MATLWNFHAHWNLCFFTECSSNDDLTSTNTEEVSYGVDAVTMELDDLYTITMIRTQGYNGNWIRWYKVYFSRNNVEWALYREEGVPRVSLDRLWNFQLTIYIGSLVWPHRKSCRYKPNVECRGVTGKFFWGAKSVFPIFSRHDFSFFLVKISILIDPKKFQCLSKSEKQLHF